MAITKIQSESLNLSDTYDFTGTVTGAGGVNTPAFEAYITGGDQAITHDTSTKVTFNAKVYDTNSDFNTSTNRFTPTVAGRYLVYTDINCQADIAQLNRFTVEIRKNGSSNKYLSNYFNNNPARISHLSVCQAIDMNGSSDYLEIWVKLEYASSGNLFVTNGSARSGFGAYKIIT